MQINTAVLIITGSAITLSASDVSRAHMSSDQRTQPQVTISTPSMGFLLMRHPVQIRPIWGVPGSTFVADPVALPHSNYAIIGANHRWAILSGDGAVSVVALAGGVTGSPQKLDIAVNPDLMVSSPGGSAAALYSMRLRTIWVVSGFDSKPQTLTVYSGTELPDAVNHLAVSDVAATSGRAASAPSARWSPPSENSPDGVPATLAVVVATSNGVALLHKGATPEQLYASAAVTSLSFIGRTADIALIDRARGEVLALSNLSRAQSVIATASNGLVNPSAIVTSSAGIAFLDGDNVFFAKYPGHSVISVKGMAGPSELTPTMIAGIVLLRGPGPGARLINFNEADPRPYLLSVPAPVSGDRSR